MNYIIVPIKTGRCLYKKSSEVMFSLRIVFSFVAVHTKLLSRFVHSNAKIMMIVEMAKRLPVGLVLTERRNAGSTYP